MFCFYCCHRSTLRWTFLLSLPLSLINPRLNSILLYFTVKIPINQPQGGLVLHLLLLPLIKPNMGWCCCHRCHCSIRRWLCCCHCCRCSVLRWALLLSLLPLFSLKVGSAGAIVAIVLVAIVQSKGALCCYPSWYCLTLRWTLLLPLFNPKVLSAVVIVATVQS